MKFPTDHDLLNQAREKSELLLDRLHKTFGGKIKPRTYRQKARADYLSLAKKRKKSRKALDKGIGKQLRYLRRNLKSIVSNRIEISPKRGIFPHGMPLRLRPARLALWQKFPGFS